MKKRALLVGLCLVMSCSAVFAETEISVESEAVSTAIVKDDFSPQLLEKIKFQRSAIYNALNLTPSQLKKKDEIDKKRYEELESPLKQLCFSRKKMKDLSECKNSSSAEIKSAKKDFETAKKNISKISNEYDKEFKKTLTSEQKAKYNMIRKLKKADMRKIQKAQKNGQKLADLRPFGQPISQAAYSEEMKRQNSFWNKLKKAVK